MYLYICTYKSCNVIQTKRFAFVSVTWSKTRETKDLYVLSKYIQHKYITIECTFLCFGSGCCTRANFQIHFYSCFAHKSRHTVETKAVCIDLIQL